LFYAQTIIFKTALILVHGEIRMNLLKNRKALSTVVTTLIILVVSVLLATVVTFYAINVTTTRVQEESIQVYKLHTWHDGGSTAETAFLIINTGGRDLVLDKITVRGQECAWATVFYNKTTATINDDLEYTAPVNSTISSVTIGTDSYSMTAASDDLILRSGYTMIVYIVNPDHISVSDIGVTVGVTIFTANAQYYKESNVQASS
jgi:hypothetical protein